jgi:hypothetical protein
MKSSATTTDAVGGKRKEERGRTEGSSVAVPVSDFPQSSVLHPHVADDTRGTESRPRDPDGREDLQANQEEFGNDHGRGRREEERGTRKDRGVVGGGTGL